MKNSTMNTQTRPQDVQASPPRTGAAPKTGTAPAAPKTGAAAANKNSPPAGKLAADTPPMTKNAAAGKTGGPPAGRETWVCELMKTGDHFCADFEQQFTGHAFFYQYGLSLFFQAPLWELRRAEDDSPPPEEADGQRIMYLLCAGNRVLMAFRTVAKDARAEPLPFDIPGLPVSIYREDNVRSAVLDAIAAARQFEEKGTATPWCFDAVPIPPPVREELGRQKYLRIPPVNAAYPTAMGADHGLVTGVAPVNGRPNWDIFCTPDTLEALTAEPEEMPWPEFTLEQRLTLLDDGLSTSPIYPVKAMQILAETPLACYLAQFPDSLNALTKGGLTPGSTYGQAAEFIYRLLQSTKTGDRDLGKDLMVALAQPSAVKYIWKEDVK